jgi:hypothetical protein
MSVAKKVLDLITPIPETDFITDEFTDSISKCCVLGHVQRLTSGNPSDYSIDNCADGIFFIRMNSLSTHIRFASCNFLALGNNIDIADINNRATVAYPQPTPKQRVVALLNDMIEAGH